jgi:hypothetical protein
MLYEKISIMALCGQKRVKYTLQFNETYKQKDTFYVIQKRSKTSACSKRLTLFCPLEAEYDLSNFNILCLKILLW